jgi:hypothetical protein
MGWEAEEPLSQNLPLLLAPSPSPGRSFQISPIGHWSIHPCVPHLVYVHPSASPPSCPSVCLSSAPSEPLQFKGAAVCLSVYPWLNPNGGHSAERPVWPFPFAWLMHSVCLCAFSLVPVCLRLTRSAGCCAASIPVVGFNAVLMSEHFAGFFAFGVLHGALAIRYIKAGRQTDVHTDGQTDGVIHGALAIR